MSVIVQKFYREPVFALGVLSAVATVLVSEHVIGGVVAVAAVAVITAAQRSLVKPAKAKR